MQSSWNSSYLKESMMGDGHTLTKPVKGISAGCRTIANNLNRNISTKTSQPEWKTGFKPPKKSTGFLIRALRTCKRAAVGNRTGHSCDATVAHLQFRLGPLKPIFIPNTVSIKFKRLITSTLEALLKFAYLHRVGCLPRILQAESPKTDKSFDNYSIRSSPHNLSIAPLFLLFLPASDAKERVNLRETPILSQGSKASFKGWCDS